MLPIKQKLFMAAGLLSVILTAGAENYTGKVLPIEGGDQVLFTFSRTYSTKGPLTLGVGEFKSPDGKTQVYEETELKGTEVVSHSVDHKQINEHGKVKVENGKVLFTYTKDGTQKTAEEKAVPNLVVSGSLVPFIQAHWDEIAKGQTVNIRYAALDRRETVGFDLFKVEHARATKDQLVIKMKPSSFIIAAIVNPLFLHFHAPSRTLSEIYGRSAPKKNENGKWKDLDAHTVYQVVKP
jgi:hypothetical protein